MTEVDFLKSIFDNPEDDVTRLAYADWLMEQGDEASQARGEFIQLQVQLARRTQGGNPAEWIDAGRLPQLRSREQALLAAHGVAWARPIAGFVSAYTFQRGFIGEVALDCLHFTACAEELFQRAPVTAVRLNNGINPQVAASAYLERVHALSFTHSHMGDNGLRILLTSKHLGRLRSLDLSHCYITDQGLAYLAASPLLGQLEHLNLGYNQIRLDGIKALFASPAWGHVQTLELKGNYYIDTRAEQFLTQSLQGTSNPSLLRSMLQTASREEREYTNVHVRSLAERAGRSPHNAAQILAEGLSDGRRTVRSSAAQMLARLGAESTSAVPRLVQRLFEETLLVRDHVAPALARLLPNLHPELQRWLCWLANPLLTAESNVRTVLARSDLPARVRDEFTVICQRRLGWWRQVRKLPAPAEVTRIPLPRLVATILDEAGVHAGRHHTGKRRTEEATTGVNKEAAWMLARLTEHIVATLPPPEASPAVNPTAQKGRRK